MKSLFVKSTFLLFLVLFSVKLEVNDKIVSNNSSISDDFQGQAFYVSKSKMELGYTK